MTLRQRLENSKRLENAIAWVLARYLRFCAKTTRWETDGVDDLRAALAEGPVVLVLWHSRILLVGLHWPTDAGRAKAIHDLAPAGRLAGATLAHFGVEPIAMSSKASNVAASRQVMRELRDGVSVGLAADGPKGPAQKLKPAAVDWARVSGRPVFMYAWAARRQFKLNTWDKLVIPLPFTRGVYGFRAWSGEIPRKVNEAERKKIRRQLARDLTAFTAEIEERSGA